MYHYHFIITPSEKALQTLANKKKQDTASIITHMHPTCVSWVTILKRSSFAFARQL